MNQSLRSGICFPLVLALWVLTPAGARAGWIPEGKILGSVEVPALHQLLNVGEPPAAPGPVRLRQEPRADAPVAVVVETWEGLVSLEHGAEQVSAVVDETRYGPDGLWYRVRYSVGDRSGEAWLAPADAGRYRMVYELLRGLAFLTAAWDGRLYDRPGGSEARAFEGLGERPDAAIADAASVGEELWLLVVLVNGSICGSGDRSVLGAGWVPAFSPEGSLTVWNYSRGC